MITKSAAWQSLKQHQQILSKTSLLTLFAEQPNRFEQYSLTAADLFLDYSKNFITNETLHLLIELANQASLISKIEDLFTGKIVNTTENKPALHTALRNTDNLPIYVQGKNITSEIKHSLDKMTTVCEKIHSQTWYGYNGKAITDIVNIGIGGSDLGPAMATEALSPYHLPQIRCHFVSNLDPCDITQTLQQLNPETTLFIIASKSFTTAETLLNANLAKNWLVQASGKPLNELQQHFFAVSANLPAALAFGIHADNCFELGDYIGGRYSLWSAIGLTLALAIGMEQFKALLNGAAAMDQHFRYAPLSQNMPVILALLGIWYHNFFKAQTHAILPYIEHLKHFPAYLQQLDMESNGKSINHQGTPIDYTTGPILWGNAGSNSQHAFHQLFHQGTHLVPIDFIVATASHSKEQQQHALLFANCLSQSRALMVGKSIAQIKQELSQKNTASEAIDQLAPHKVLPGNRPSNILVMPKLTPHTLGALIALYEHKVFVQSVIWDINPFDQWGIILGKQLAEPIYQALQQEKVADCEHFDASTNGLIKYYQNINQKTPKANSVC
jgi:glucose-6-phosphate isomerase